VWLITMAPHLPIALQITTTEHVVQDTDSANLIPLTLIRNAELCCRIIRRLTKNKTFR
jgi:hypothetical protein